MLAFLSVRKTIAEQRRRSRLATCIDGTTSDNQSSAMLVLAPKVQAGLRRAGTPRASQQLCVARFESPRADSLASGPTISGWNLDDGDL
jgi:hypothetical protein